MPDSTMRIDQAAALHRQAEATADAAAAALAAQAPSAGDPLEQHRLAEQLRAAAGELARAGSARRSTRTRRRSARWGVPPQFVRLGLAQPLADAHFPAVIPLLGIGHLTVDADARDARVLGLLRCVLLRLLASAPAGSLLVHAVDGTGGGSVFAPFLSLADAGLLDQMVTDRAGLRDVLSEAEKWLRPSRAGAPRRGRRDRMLLVVIAGLPDHTDGSDLVRIAALAQQGPDRASHLIVAGWPSPAKAAEGSRQPAEEKAARGELTQPALPRTTKVSLQGEFAVVGDPPIGTFGSTPGAHLLNAPVYLDEDPPASLVDAVCRELAAHSAAASRVTLADLLPDPSESCGARTRRTAWT